MKPRESSGDAGSRGSLPSAAAAVIKRCQQVFGLVALAVIAFLLYRHREIALSLAKSATAIPIICAALVLVGLHIVIAVGFHRLHRSVGVNRRLGDAMTSYFVRLPARYLPGGIWHTASRYADIHANQPIDRLTVGTLFVAETGVVALTGLLVAGIAARTFLPELSFGSQLAILLIAAATILTIVLAAAARRAKVYPHPAEFAAAVVLLAANWVGLGVAFVLYTRGLGGSSLASCDASIVATTYDMAATLGYITLIAPQGWGVTELSFGALKTCAADMPTSVAALTGFRIVAIIADAGAYAVWVLAMLGTRAWRQRHASQ
jgi:hypothetical protein